MTYDHIDWEYLKEVMLKIGFNDHWIIPFLLIMKCWDLIFLDLVNDKLFHCCHKSFLYSTSKIIFFIALFLRLVIIQIWTVSNQVTKFLAVEATILISIVILVG